MQCGHAPLDAITTGSDDESLDIYRVPRDSWTRRLRSRFFIGTNETVIFFVVILRAQGTDQIPKLVDSFTWSRP
jgi:hypothetical protein